MRTEKRKRGRLGPVWSEVLRNEYGRHQARPIDEFWNEYSRNYKRVKELIMTGDSAEVLGFLEWIRRDANIPKDFATEVNDGLKRARAVYPLVEGDMLSTVSDPLVTEALERALKDVGNSGMTGARSHLRSAIDHLAADQYANSVRESIHAVEAVARGLFPSAKTLGDALAKMRVDTIHPSIRNSLSALYGYTNQEPGVRHSLVDGDAAKVDEADALFMLGACAAFVSYLIAKGQAAGLIK